MTTLEIENSHVTLENKEILKGVNLIVNTGKNHVVINHYGASNLSRDGRLYLY